MSAELKKFGRQLHGWGANVTVIGAGGKRPLHPWQHWQTTRQTEEEFEGLPWNKAVAIGLVNGSGNFRIFDLDAAKDKDGRPLFYVPEAILETVLRAIGLPVDYQWSYGSGSGAGWGFVVKSEEALPDDWLPDERGVFTGLPLEGLELDHLELRWNSGQTIITGQHPIGPGYRWRRDEPPFLIPATRSVEKIICAFEAVATLKRTAVATHKITIPASSGKHPAYGQAALSSAVHQVSTAFPGNRNNLLFQQTAALAELVNGSLLDRQEVEQGMTGAALAAGLQNGEVEATINSAFKTTGNKARQVDLYEGDGTGETAVSSDRAIFSTFADIEMVTGSIEWVWRGWLANRYMHILASEPGVGKSYLAMRIAGCFLLGMDWPDGKPFTGELGKVLWCEAEAAQQLNMERAKKLCLPLEKILMPNFDPLHDIDFRNSQDKDTIWALAHDPEVKLIVVDSLSGADPREENSSDKLGILKWWAELARNSGKPIIITHHLNKPLQGNDKVTLHRLRGSSAIVQVARIVWAIDTPDLNQKEQKRLVILKNNLAAFPDPIGISIGEKIQFGPAPMEPGNHSAVDRAIDFLRSLLEKEPLPSKVIFEEADSAGISKSTLKRAKEQLGVIAEKRPNHWAWSLPTALEE